MYISHHYYKNISTLSICYKSPVVVMCLLPTNPADQSVNSWQIWVSSNEEQKANCGISFKWFLWCSLTSEFLPSVYASCWGQVTWIKFILCLSLSILTRTITDLCSHVECIRKTPWSQQWETWDSWKGMSWATQALM